MRFLPREILRPASGEVLVATGVRPVNAFPPLHWKRKPGSLCVCDDAATAQCGGNRFPTVEDCVLRGDPR